jgi:hypothetical protein
MSFDGRARRPVLQLARGVAVVDVSQMCPVWTFGGGRTGDRHACKSSAGRSAPRRLFRFVGHPLGGVVPHVWLGRSDCDHALAEAFHQIQEPFAPVHISRTARVRVLAAPRMHHIDPRYGGRSRNLPQIAQYCIGLTSVTAATARRPRQRPRRTTARTRMRGPTPSSSVFRARAP